MNSGTGYMPVPVTSVEMGQMGSGIQTPNPNYEADEFGNVYAPEYVEPNGHAVNIDHIWKLSVNFIQTERFWRIILWIGKIILLLAVVGCIVGVSIFYEEATKTQLSFYSERMQDPGPKNSSCYNLLNERGHLTDKDKSNRFCIYTNAMPHYPFFTFAWIAEGWLVIALFIMCIDSVLFEGHDKQHVSVMQRNVGLWNVGTHHFRALLSGHAWPVVIVFGIPFACIFITMPSVLGFHELFITIVVAGFALGLVWFAFVMSITYGYILIPKQIQSYQNNSERQYATSYGPIKAVAKRAFDKSVARFNVGACLFLLFLFTTAFFGLTVSNIDEPAAVWVCYLWVWVFIAVFILHGLLNLLLSYWYTAQHIAADPNVTYDTANAFLISLRGFHLSVNVGQLMVLRVISDIVMHVLACIYVVGYFWIVGGLFYKYKFVV